MVYLGSTKLGRSELGSTAIKAERGKYFAEKYASASAIYSLRKTNPSQEHCLQIRRASDNAEKKIGFTGNDLDEATIAEFGGYNLLGYTEDFTDASWIKENCTLQETAEASPVDSNFLKIVDDTNTGFHRITAAGAFETKIGQFYNYSCFVKAAEYSRFNLIAGGTEVNFKLTHFNISTGVVEAGDGNIEDLGNGIYRCSISTDAISDSFLGRIDIELVNDGLQRNFTGDGAKGIYVIGAQVTEGTSALDYQPRMPAKNLLTYTENLEILGTSIRITVQDAQESFSLVSKTQEFKETVETGQHLLSINLPFSFVAGNYYTCSFYVKASGRNKVSISFRSDWFVSFSAPIFDLSNGTEQKGTGEVTSQIIDVGSGFYRCSVTVLCDATGTSPSDIYLYLLDDSNNYSYLGDDNLGLIIAAPQLELGSTATDYYEVIGPEETGAGADNCYVSKWFDGTDNNFDATQSVLANQPKTYDASTGVIKTNRKPAIEWPDDLNSSRLEYSAALLSVGDVYAVAQSSRADTFNEYLGVYSALLAASSSNGGICLVGQKNQADWYSVDKIWNNLRQNGVEISSPFQAFPTVGNQTLIATYQPTIKILNGLAIGTDRLLTNRGWQGTIQEIIVFDSDQTPNRTAIEADINNYWGIH